MALKSEGTEKSGEKQGNSEVDVAAELKSLQEAHAALTNQHEQLIADHQAELDRLNEQHTAKLTEKDSRIGKLEADLQNAQVANTASPAKAKAKKVTTKKVVSNTNYNYKIDGIQITPDVPVKLEHYEGNELDSLMQAGLVVEYSAED